MIEEQQHIKELLFSTKTDPWLNDVLRTMSIEQRDKVFTFANWLIVDSFWFPFISLNSIDYIRGNRINGEFESKIFSDSRNVNEILCKFLEFCWVFIAHIAVFCECVKNPRFKVKMLGIDEFDTSDDLFEILEKTFDMFCETKVKPRLDQEDEFLALVSEFLCIATTLKRSKIQSMEKTVRDVIAEWVRKKERKERLT